MPKLKSSFFPAVLLAALCSPFVMAQVEPGSLDDLLGADFAPLNATLDSSDQQLPDLDLHAPLLMPQGQQAPELAPRVQLPPVPQLEPAQARSVLEVPRVMPSEPAPEALVLPELTMPTPENTRAVLGEERRVLRPQLDIRPNEQIELLPFDDRDAIQARTPQMRTPKALPYGSSTYGSNSRSAYAARSRLVAVPIQIEFLTVTRRYVPYGGFGSIGYGYRPYGSYRPGYAPRGYRSTGGYVPWGGYGGRDCPYRR